MVLVYVKILFYGIPQTSQAIVRTVPNILLLFLLLIFSLNQFHSIVCLFFATDKDHHPLCMELRSNNQ
jgi:hypothetical protein